MNTRKSYHESLDELQQYLIAMGNEVTRQISTAIQSLSELNAQLAKEVVDNDDAIDRMMLRVEERCLRLIALQQPMAKDLRMIGMATKIATDLERAADHAVDIAKVTLTLNGERLIKPLVDIPRMAELAIQMLKDSLIAFRKQDIQLAASLAAKDDEVDHIYKGLLQELARLVSEQPSSGRQLIHLTLVAQVLERVADHATNIGEGVIYLVTGHRKDLNP